MPSSGIAFDLTVSIGNLLTVGAILGGAWFYNYRQSIIRATQHEQTLKTLDAVQASTEKTATAVGDMKSDLAAVKEQGSQTARAVASLRETVQDVKLGQEAMKTQLNETDRISRDTRNEVNEVSHRVTRLDAQMEVLRGGTGDPQRAVARAIAQGRSGTEEPQ